MRHIEMHVIETVKDLELADVAGLDVYATETCEECFEQVGEDVGNFKKFVVLLDDESEWIVCENCASPVL
jgi:enoyl-[acyl-carrier-protein] reductase (NADH)